MCPGHVADDRTIALGPEQLREPPPRTNHAYRIARANFAKRMDGNPDCAQLGRDSWVIADVPALSRASVSIIVSTPPYRFPLCT